MKTLFSLILLAASVALFFVYTNPQYTQIKSLEQEDSDYNKALSQSNVLLTQRDQLQDQYSKIPQNDLDRLSKLLPNTVDNVRLVKDINGIANNYGMTINDIKISQGGTDQSNAAIGPSSSSYGSLVLSFSVVGSYSTFKQFLQSLEQSLRLVDIISLSFSANDTTGQNSYSVSIKTYWLK